MNAVSYSPENREVHVVLLQNVISPLVSFWDTIWLSDEGRLFKAALALALRRKVACGALSPK